MKGVGVGIAEGEGAKVVYVPVGTAAYEREQAIAAAKDGDADSLAHLLARMPDKQAAALITAGSLVHRTGYLERAMKPSLSWAACERADNGALWAYENILDLPGTAEQIPFSQKAARWVGRPYTRTNRYKRDFQLGREAWGYPKRWRDACPRL